MLCDGKNVIEPKQIQNQLKITHGAKQNKIEQNRAE